MKKLILSSSFVFLCVVNSCSPPASVSVAEPRPAQDSNGAAPIPVPTSGLDGLKAGVLPDPSLSTEEQKLTGFLQRKPNPDFPLKIGIVFYKTASLLSQNNRTEIYDRFKEELGNNQNVSQVVEIPSSLISSNTTIEDLRSLGARFQVSTILVINDTYQNAAENKNALVTPIDIISGIRTWESNAVIEAFALDVLNGVAVFSTSATAKESAKYNIENQKVKAETLLKASALKAWENIKNKITSEIAAYKSRVGK